MPHLPRKLAFLSLGAVLIVSLVVGVALAGAGKAQGPATSGDKAAKADKTKPAKADKAKPAPAKAKADPAQYAGADTCQACHTEVYQKFETSPHWKTMIDTRRGPEWTGCEACHGPGAEHAGTGDVEKIFNFKKDVSAKRISETCMGCHQYGEEHSNFDRSAHNLNDVSCLDCHSVHNAKVRQFQLVKAQPELCYTCHMEIKPLFARPFRHRVNEGLVNCTDCHNQHGGFLTRAVRATAAQDQTCFTCHVDKAGPFVFEHAPVKTEGCVACHVPHGSSNPRLLKRSQINLLCLECHTLTVDSDIAGIPSFHNQANKYQACTLCHSAIHGSNQSHVFFK